MSDYSIVDPKIALQDAEWQLESQRDAEEQVKICLDLIDKFLLTKKKHMQECRRSYGLKHDFESISKHYINNGAAIKAMVLRGFTPYQHWQLICGSSKERRMHNYGFNFLKKEWESMCQEKPDKQKKGYFF